MDFSDIHIIKVNGEKVPFSAQKVASSLQRSGATQEVVQQILNVLETELHEGMSTKQIYKRAFELLKKKNTGLASKFKLKKAIFELGPTGFPFENFVAAIFEAKGYTTKVGQTLQGKCVSHEVDVIAKKDAEVLFMECKFHSLQGKNTDVKVPLYIDSRFKDLASQNIQAENYFTQGMIVSNTRFTADALAYAKCANISLLSWDYPKGKGLKDLIDTTKLYPITVSTLLTVKEKQFLLDRAIVLCKDLLKNKFLLDVLGTSENRQQKIFDEMEKICHF